MCCVHTGEEFRPYNARAMVVPGTLFLIVCYE